MILVDTSVWIDHFISPIDELGGLLADRRVLVHRFVTGELAMGNLSQRRRALDALRTEAQAFVVDTDHVLDMIESERLFGLGVGFIDVHLLASVLAAPNVLLWSKDRRLLSLAERFNVAYRPLAGASS